MYWQAKGTKAVSKGPFQCGNKSCHYFFTIDYNCWLGHIASPGHSENVDIPGQSSPFLRGVPNRSNKEELEAWLLVRGLERRLQNINLLKFFSRWGSVVDFKRLDNFQSILKFNSPDSVTEVILSEKESRHEIEELLLEVYQMNPSICLQIASELKYRPKSGASTQGTGSKFIYPKPPEPLPFLKQQREPPPPPPAPVPVRHQPQVIFYQEASNCNENPLPSFFASVLTATGVPSPLNCQNINNIQQRVRCDETANTSFYFDTVGKLQSLSSSSTVRNNMEGHSSHRREEQSRSQRSPVSTKVRRSIPSLQRKHSHDLKNGEFYPEDNEGHLETRVKRLNSAVLDEGRKPRFNLNTNKTPTSKRGEFYPEDKEGQLGLETRVKRLNSAVLDEGRKPRFNLKTCKSVKSPTSKSGEFYPEDKEGQLDLETKVKRVNCALLEEDRRPRLNLKTSKNLTSKSRRPNIFERIWAEKLTAKFSTLKLEKQLEVFLDDILVDDLSIFQRIYIMKRFFEFLRVCNPSIKELSVFPCGMDYLGIGFENDPVDIFVDFLGWLGNTEGEKERKFLNSRWTKILSALSGLEDEEEFSENVYDLKEESQEQSEGAQRDRISFTFQGDSQSDVIRLTHDDFPTVQLIRLAKFYCSLDPRVQSLLAIVRYWLFFHKIFPTLDVDAKNIIGILLVISFLIRKKVIPSVFDLQEKVKSEEKICFPGNIELAFCTQAELVHPTKNSTASLLKDKEIWTHSTLSLLKEFFTEYGAGDLITNGISSPSGEFVKKSDFKSGAERNLPLKLKELYVSQVIYQGSRERREFYSSHFLLQHPFELTRNVGGGVNSLDVQHFKSMCSASANKLRGILTMDTDKPNFMDLFVDTDLIIVDSAQDCEFKLKTPSKKVLPPSVEDWEKHCKFYRKRMSVPEGRKASTPSTNDRFASSSSGRSRAEKLGWTNSPTVIKKEYASPKSTSTSECRREVSSPMTFIKPSTSSQEIYFPLSSLVGGGKEKEIPKGGNWVPLAQPLLMPQTDEFYNLLDTEFGERNPYSSEGIVGPLRIFKCGMREGTVKYFLDGMKIYASPEEIRGKMQSLYFNFIKRFNTYFWRTCCGLQLKVHSNHVNRYADLSIYSDSQIFRSIGNSTLSQRLAVVPPIDVEQNPPNNKFKFKCESGNNVLIPLCSSVIGQHGLNEPSFVSEWAKLMDRVLRGFSKPNCLFERADFIHLKFEAELLITLDFHDLKNSAHPTATLVFKEDGKTTREMKTLLDFMGRLFQTLAPLFVERSFKDWLKSCSDFNVKLAVEYSRSLRGENKEKVEERLERNPLGIPLEKFPNQRRRKVKTGEPRMKKKTRKQMAAAFVSQNFNSTRRLKKKQASFLKKRVAKNQFEFKDFVETFKASNFPGTDK